MTMSSTKSAVSTNFSADDVFAGAAPCDGPSSQKKQPTAAEKKSQRELPRHIAQPTATITHGMMARRNSAVLVGAAPRGGPYSSTRRINTANHPTINAQTWQAFTALYQKNPIEHSLFVLADGSFKITTGDALTTSSVLYTNAGEVEFAAHTHAGPADFSLEDAQILIARLLKNPQKEIEHTILGRGDSGEIEWQRVTLAINNGTLVVTSEADGIAAGRLSTTKELMREVFAAGQGLEPAALELWANQQAQASQMIGYVLPRKMSSGQERGEFLAAVTATDWVDYFSELTEVKELTEGQSQTFVLSGILGTCTQSLTLSTNEKRKVANYFHLTFSVRRLNGQIVVTTKGCHDLDKNPDIIRAAIAENTSIDWRGTREEFAEACERIWTAAFENKIMRDVFYGQNANGAWKIPDINSDRNKFLLFLKTTDFKKIIQCVPAFSALNDGESHTMTLTGMLGSTIKSLMLSSGVISRKSLPYFHLNLNVERVDGELVVYTKGCYDDDTNASEIMASVAQNMSFDWQSTRRVHTAEYAKLCARALETIIIGEGLGGLIQKTSWGVPERTFDRNAYWQFLKDYNFTVAFNNAPILSAMKDGESMTFTMSGRFDPKINHLSIDAGEEKTQRAYCHLTFVVTRIGDRFCVTTKGSDDADASAVQTRASIAENSHIDWRQTRVHFPQAFDKMAVAALQDVVIGKEGVGATRNKNVGWELPPGKDLIPAFAAFLSQFDFASAVENIKILQVLPDGESLAMSLNVCIQEPIKGLDLTVVDGNTNAGLNHIIFIVTRRGNKFIVTTKGSAKEEHRSQDVNAALAKNHSLDWQTTQTEFPDAYAVISTAALYEDIVRKKMRMGRALPGTEGLKIERGRDEFLEFLRHCDFDALLKGIAAFSQLQDDHTHAYTLYGAMDPATIGELSLVAGQVYIKGSYFFLTITVTRNNGAPTMSVKELQGINAPLIAMALRVNPHIQLPSWFYGAYGRPATHNSRSLLARLSELGRTRLLHKMRALGFGLEDDTVAATPQNIAHAAREVLLDLAREFDHTKKKSLSWSNNDPRLGLALTFSSFTGDQKFSPDEATLVSALAMNALTRAREHALLEHRRALREAGDSPIAESAWDNVFSDELKSYMRGVAKEMFGLDIGDADLAHEMLRIPFNEIVGASYFKLTQNALHNAGVGDPVAMSHEILLHAWHQKRRGDTLTWFIDGYQKACSFDRSRVLRIVNFEIDNITALFNSWQLDTESPFRLINGLSAAAARFLWDAVFEDATRAELISLAKEIFPQHAEEFKDKTNLAKELPQSLFMELVGLLAARKQKIWHENQSLGTALNLLDLYLGLGADTVLSFLRGYESQTPIRNAREDLKTLTTGLAGQQGDAADTVRKYLEQNFTFDRNVIEDSHYKSAPITVRRGEMIEGILTGLTLGVQTGALRLFRLSGMTRETEVALMREAVELISSGKKLPPTMTAQILLLLDLYTMPPRPRPKDFDFNRWLNPSPEDRWHRLATWSHGDPQAMVRLLDAVVQTTIPTGQ